MLTRRVCLFSMSLFLAVSFPLAVRAQNCGDTISGTVTLTNDLNCPLGHGLLLSSGATLDCAGHSITGGDKIEQYGVYLSDVTNANVLNCTVQHFEVGIRLAGAIGCAVQNNISQVNTRYGAEITQGSTGAVVQGNTFYNNSDEGLHISGLTGGVASETTHQIIGNTVSSNSAEGIYLLSSNGNIITGNTVQNQGAAGMYVKNSNSNTIQGNTLTNNPIQLVTNSQFNTLTSNTIIADRLKLDSSSNNQVNNQSIQARSGRPSTAYDLNNSSDNIIIDSSASRPGDYHIRVANQSLNNVFTRFTPVGQTLKCYVDASAGVTVTNSNGQILKCTKK